MLADKLAHAEDRLAVREAELFTSLVRTLGSPANRLHGLAETLAAWDVASSLAEVAQREDYVRPLVDDSLELVLKDARHPVVEKLAAAGSFVPNDVMLDASQDAVTGRMWLITGPNMAGKSTLMRQTALCVILAQMGAFVPAREARIGVVDRVLTRVGASDNLARGDSTFMVEMKETAHVLRRATRRSHLWRARGRHQEVARHRPGPARCGLRPPGRRPCAEPAHCARSLAQDLHRAARR